MEWPDYYEDANLNDLLRFFDRYLKGVDNGWEDTPRVRYAVLDLEGGDSVNIPADTFPPADVVSTRYYLDAASQSLTVEIPALAGSASYDGGAEDGRAEFTLRFGGGAEFVGYPKACLWVEAQGSDDMDLFVFVQKLNSDGETLEQFNVPNQGPVMQGLTKQGAAILKYKGSNGRLRASMRHLDPEISTNDIPVQSFDRVEKLSAGDVVLVEIDLFPIGLRLHPGEQLRVIVTGHHLFGGVMPGADNVASENRGRHVIHTGGAQASFIQLPLMPGATR